MPGLDRFCAHDGHTLARIGVETSEQLDVIPEQVRVVQHQRVKYACPCCDLGIKVTPAPARIIPPGLLTESALAWIPPIVLLISNKLDVDDIRWSDSAVLLSANGSWYTFAG
ncbi:hypothetical protein LMG22037_05689 [Paraburkholderia phenoliruptrix]|uniref:Transposase IS66 zinc-finger binding domain-containing protein n=1 Tax=Paraburkholderia phenoliruptrix TaxID=252970 RepID=A0A6J5CBB9_9BURK|nr:hypothetical protein LMG22037_05689 [Paraburkholderia phenoliruptrix]